MKINYIYNECCLKTLNRLKDNSINTVITSPPYNMNLRVRNNQYCSRQITKELTTKYNGFTDNLTLNQYNRFHTKVLTHLLRVSPIVFYNIQIVTGSKRSVFKMIGQYADYLKEIIIWDKGHAEPSIQSGVLNKRTELILVFDKYDSICRKFKNANFERGTLEDIWFIPKNKKNLESHKAIFPEQLAYKILKNFTNEGDIIYDPFMGTGTTAYVCKSMNRKFIGSEINKNYIDIAKQRLEHKILAEYNQELKRHKQHSLF